VRKKSHMARLAAYGCYIVNRTVRLHCVVVVYQFWGAGSGVWVGRFTASLLAITKYSGLRSPRCEATKDSGGWVVVGCWHRLTCSKDCQAPATPSLLVPLPEEACLPSYF
jgi:hypothetical protein